MNPRGQLLPRHFAWKPQSEPQRPTFAQTLRFKATGLFKKHVFYEENAKMTPELDRKEALRAHETLVFAKTLVFLHVLGRLAGAGSVGGG